MTTESPINRQEQIRIGGYVPDFVHRLFTDYWKIGGHTPSYITRSAVAYWFLHGCPKLTREEWDRVKNLEVLAQPED